MEAPEAPGLPPLRRGEAAPVPGLAVDADVEAGAAGCAADPAAATGPATGQIGTHVDARTDARIDGGALCVGAGADADAGVQFGAGPAPAAEDAAAQDVALHRTQQARERAVFAITIASIVATLSASIQVVLRLARGVRPVLAFFPFLLPLFSRIEEDQLLDNPVRARVHDLVVQQPGASLQQVRQQAGIAWGTAVHHLQRLEQHGKVVSLRQGSHRRYFPANTGASGQRRGIAALAHPTARRIARCVQRSPGIDQKTLCGILGLRNPAASKHLARLAGHGLVTVEAAGRSRRYHGTPSLQAALAAITPTPTPPAPITVTRTTRPTPVELPA